MSSVIQYGCLFCRSGMETAIAKDIESNIDSMRAVVPSRIRYRRNKGIMMTEADILFPGYVFFKALEEICISKILRHKYVYKLLEDGAGNWCLTGADLAMAEKLFSTNGVVGLSKVYYDAHHRIQVVDGFLKGREKDIVRVNHRMRAAEIKMEINGKPILTWFGFEIIKNNA